MTDTAPTPTSWERERIQRACAADPMDQMFQDYRPMTAGDVLRFDAHWLGLLDRPGRIDRMRIKPLRILRDFLHRLEAGLNTPCRPPAASHGVLLRTEIC